MKEKNWWLKDGLLTSGGDPTANLSFAAGTFPSEYVPMVFMTGDGHRTPPFKWTTRGVWKDFFSEVVKDNKLCCHIETYADKVKLSSVPAELSDVFHNKKVFGWEPEVYKIIQNVMEMILEIVSKMPKTVALRDIHDLSKQMWRVHDHGYLKSEGKLGMTFWEIAKQTGKDQVPLNLMPGYMGFLLEYNTRAMELRTGINDVIGANIQKIINLYPDHMHLITCGDAHIFHNPLHRFIEPPVGTFGIVDSNSA